MTLKQKPKLKPKYDLNSTRYCTYYKKTKSVVPASLLVPQPGTYFA